ncbi:MAG: DUF5131 family protein [Polyangiaceae bacterium]|nr:DUF5131 family protein [Polyangiaceae bacterium]
MGDTSIGWTDKTWNPVRGCTVVSAECENCYAMGFAARFSGEGQPYEGLARFSDKKHLPQWTGAVRFVPSMLDQPLRWRRARRIFVNSMSDLFHEKLSNEAIAAVFGVMAAAPQHTFQVLTKRPQRAIEWFSWLDWMGGLGGYVRSHRVGSGGLLPSLFDAVARTEMIQGRRTRSRNDPWASVFNAAAVIGRGPLPNVHIGVSAGTQASVDDFIPKLLQIPASIRFVSAEPLLEEVDLSKWLTRRDRVQMEAFTPEAKAVYGEGRHERDRIVRGVDWVIAGGESGHGARPCDIRWIESVAKQCADAGAPCFVKQLGANPHANIPTIVVGWRPGAPEPDTRLRLKDRAGADPSEWPEALRVQQFPRGGTV